MSKEYRASCTFSTGGDSTIFRTRSASLFPPHRLQWYALSPESASGARCAEKHASTSAPAATMGMHTSWNSSGRALAMRHPQHVVTYSHFPRYRERRDDEEEDDGDDGDDKEFAPSPPTVAEAASIRSNSSRANSTGSCCSSAASPSVFASSSASSADAAPWCILWKMSRIRPTTRPIDFREEARDAQSSSHRRRCRRCGEGGER
mmetsp:Transcript_32748/g.50703  ORF Transcript_32748/g.50703 Transcript_32748/m.50703 type:complete len:205 (-) Transcript_32748:120-734(-)